MRNFILILILFFSITACTDTAKRKQEMIDQEVNSVVESYHQKRYKECMSAIIDSANKITDSLILLKMTAVDTSLLTGRPKRPLKPIIKSPLDTTPVKPILQK
jgi:hypothetical protein